MQEMQETIPWWGRSPGGQLWQPTLLFFSGESRGQRSLMGYSPLGRKELDMTEATEHAHMYKESTSHVIITTEHGNYI